MLPWSLCCLRNVHVLRLGVCVSGNLVNSLEQFPQSLEQGQMEILEMIYALDVEPKTRNHLVKLLPPPLSLVSSRVMSHDGVSVLLTSVQHFSDDFFFKE